MTATPDVPPGLQTPVVPTARSSPAADRDTVNPVEETRVFFRGRTRWLVAAVLPIGALLQVAEFVLETPKDDNTERVAYWADHTTRVGLSMGLGTLAVPFLIGGFAVLVALSWRDSRTLASAAGVALTFAMAGLAGVHGLEMTAYGLLRGHDASAAVAALDGKHLGFPGGVLLAMFLVGALVGIVLLVIALWRSQLVPRLVPALVLGFGVLDIAVQLGKTGHVVNLVAALLVGAAIVADYTRRTHGLWWPLTRPGRP